jgi:outer membrane protein assembly factor BamB
MSDSPQSPSEARRVRWLPLWIIVILLALALGTLEFMQHPSAQQKWMKQAGIGLVGAGLIAVWFLFFSGISGAIRKKTALGIALLAVLAVGLFRYEGVSGDLYPRFGWRWGQSGPPPLEAHPSNAASPVATPEGAADFPQFLGPNRNGKLTGPKLALDWKKSPPKELWRRPVGQAWTGFSVSGGLAITQEQREEQELVVCYSLLTGDIIWSHADDVRYENPLGGVGPRANPTIDSGRVYTFGAKGTLNCLELATGRLIWAKNVIDSNGGTVPEWGASASPLVVSDAVVVAAGQPKGGTLAAYHKVTGVRLWISGNQAASYSSPIVAKLSGLEQIVYFGPQALAGFDIASGKLLWEYPCFPGNPHVANPVPLLESSVLVSVGYGQGSALVKVSREADGTWKTEQTWKLNRMKAKFTNLIEFGGLIFGLDDGNFACLNPNTETGEAALLWKDGRYGHGQILLVDKTLLVMAEDGSVVLVEPNPSGLKEITQAKLLKDKTWNPPALAGRYLLVRNDKEAACFLLPTE